MTEADNRKVFLDKSPLPEKPVYSETTPTSIRRYREFEAKRFVVALLSQKRAKKALFGCQNSPVNNVPIRVNSYS